LTAKRTRRPPPPQPAGSDLPPTSAKELADWLSQGVQAEVEALQEDGGEQRYELISGELAQRVSDCEGVFTFVIADGTRIPEDASGQLKTDATDYSASIIGQQSNRLQVQLESQGALPERISRGILIVDDTALLRRLSEWLDSYVPSGEASLVVRAFHPELATPTTRLLPATESLVKLTGDTRRVVEQATASDVTFVWGPPGTGKTFAIAHMVEAFVERGQKVLVTSHTHAAVDAALYEAISGALADGRALSEGRIIRIGRTSDPKIPDDVRLDAIVARQAEQLTDRMLALEKNARPLSERRAELEGPLQVWKTLDELRERLSEQTGRVNEVVRSKAGAESRLKETQNSIEQHQRALNKAQSAWFGRQRRIRSASLRLSRARDDQDVAQETLDRISDGLRPVLTTQQSLEREVANVETTSSAIPSREELIADLRSVSATLDEVESEIQVCQESIAQLEEKVIDEAAAVFMTLTKAYVDERWNSRQFEAVIVDEISMALPPLIFVAAAHAVSHFVLVGDFHQLPPIVRSDSQISNVRLKDDLFRLAGVVRKDKPVSKMGVLASLHEQRRMVTPIADLARHLVYGKAIRDHSSVRRAAPKWLQFLPDDALVIVDTADLHCWSGKQAGSLSRFNFYSATLSVELAALAVAQMGEAPPDGGRPPVGVVTPYAAQRRLLSRLVRELDLGAWVAPGTVHTFQGSQADLIVFDSVLDEPYYTAHLSDPHGWSDVIRQLNVAVTRSKDKFVFVGSSEWLNSHARPGSGLGHLWQFLKDRAALIPAADLVSSGLFELASVAREDGGAWTLPQAPDGPALEILDERSFFSRFEADLATASSSVFGLVPFFGEYRWPRVEPSIAAALSRGVEVTLVTPTLREASNPTYVARAIQQLRERGAIVLESEGLHGKDVIIDEKILYTGSLNWASHRGRSEIMHRISSRPFAQLELQYLQARHIRRAAVHEDGTPRTCPICGGSTRVINQRKQPPAWDHQAMKVGCANPGCQKYLRNVDERSPFREPPVCHVDGRTKYRRVKRGRGERWQCPKHPRTCQGEKVVPGDP
jgi:hypothetical protein